MIVGVLKESGFILNLLWKGGDSCSRTRGLDKVRTSIFTLSFEFFLTKNTHKNEGYE
jgi:hypothetical protein